MRNVSADYAPFTQAREIDFTISFGVMLDNATLDTLQGTGSAAFVGNVGAVTNNIAAPSACFASLERDCWHLDGKHTVAKDDIKAYEFGYWSMAVSGADGVFSSPPYIDFAFGSVVSSLGWTFTFDTKADEWPAEITYMTFDEDGNPKDTGKIYPTGAAYQFEEECRDYKRVRFAFNRTSNPYRRARITELNFGITRVYNRDSLVSVNLSYGAEPTCAAIASSELVFKFDNTDKKYNLLNPDDVYQYLQDGQAISVHGAINGESVYMGTYYYHSVSAGDSALTPTIRAYDRIMALDNAEFEGGRDEVVSLRAAVNEITRNYHLTVNYNGYEDVLVNMAVPPESSIREALRLVVQAACCTCYIDRDGVLQIKPLTLAASPVSAITANELYDYSGVTVEAVVDCVKLNAGNEYTEERRNYVAGDEEGESIKSVKNPCVAPARGEAVAAWLLEMYNRRKQYKVKNRCDIAVEIGDTVNIADIFDNHENANITGISMVYDGGLYAETEGVGL